MGAQSEEQVYTLYTLYTLCFTLYVLYIVAILYALYLPYAQCTTVLRNRPAVTQYILPNGIWALHATPHLFTGQNAYINFTPVHIVCTM
jgi:hypothetical protein